MDIDMLFVPSQDDVILIPSSSCEECTRMKTSYIKRWNKISEQEVRELIKYDVKRLRIRCECKRVI